MDRTGRYNAIIGTGVAITIVLVVGFVAAAMQSGWGDAAVGLGGILGGGIGALGAAGAVYILIDRERAEEAEKTTAAVLHEVAAFAKFPLGQLAFCQQVAERRAIAPHSVASG